MNRFAVPLVTIVASIGAGIALAKLPPPSDEAKAKAVETAAKAAWSDKMAAYKLCKSMDKVAADYYADAKKTGKQVKAALATPPCTDPGPYSTSPPAKSPENAASPTAPTSQAGSKK